MSERFTDIARWFETLTPATLPTIGDVYAQDAHFKDPFNDLRGIESVRAVYAHMFDGLPSAHFEIDHVIAQGSHACLVWRFLARWRSHPIVIHGSTHLTLGAQGLICDHRDYWDTGEELYEKIPVLASVLRLIRHKLATPQA